jgi:hypothetical protein
VWCREPRRVSALAELPRRDARALGHRDHLRPHHVGTDRGLADQVPKPQSLPAITFSRPTSFA